METHDSVAAIPGRQLLLVGLYGLGALSLFGLLSGLSDVFVYLAAGLSLLMFVATVVLFAFAFTRVVGRSRYEEIAVGSVWGLEGSAPKPIARGFRAQFVGYFLVPLVVSVLHPDSLLVFSWLAAGFPWSLAGFWASRYGAFSPRVQTARGRAKSSSGSKAAPSKAKPRGGRR